MKKLLFIVTLFLFQFVGAQEKEEHTSGKNEIHFNAFYPVAFKAFELTYERNLSESTSLGVSYTLGNEDYFFTKHAISPFFRKYFSTKDAKGFFVEPFLMLNSGENHEEYDSNCNCYVVNSKNYLDLAVGIGLGGKFIANDNFVGTINAGIGRNIDGAYHEEIVLKAGIHLGYRF